MKKAQGGDSVDVETKLFLETFKGDLISEVKEEVKDLFKEMKEHIDKVNTIQISNINEHLQRHDESHKLHFKRTEALQDTCTKMEIEFNEKLTGQRESIMSAVKSDKKWSVNLIIGIIAASPGIIGLILLLAGK